jgi:hypothetical protein
LQFQEIKIVRNVDMGLKCPYTKKLIRKTNTYTCNAKYLGGRPIIGPFGAFRRAYVY